VATDEAREARHHEKLQVYSLAGRGEGLTVEAAYVHDLHAGTRAAADISAEASGRALTSVTQRLAALREARFEPKPEARRCSSCEYAGICGHVAGAETTGDIPRKISASC